MARVSMLVVFVVLFLVPLVAHGQISDTTAPTITSLTFSPTSVDVTSDSQQVTVTVDLVDDLSGVRFGAATFCSPSHGQCQSAYFDQPILGTALNGQYLGTLTIPRFVASGAWSLSAVDLYDSAGNRRYYQTEELQSLGFPTSLTVVSEQDIAPPKLTTFSFSASSVDVSNGPQNLVVTMSLTDNLSGVDLQGVRGYGIALAIASPSGKQTKRVSHLEFTQVSGTLTNGTWDTTITLPQYSESGIWKVLIIYVWDMVGNNLVIAGDDLNAFGSAVEFQVQSQISDTQAPLLTGLDFSPTLIDTSSQNQTVTLSVRATDNLSGVDWSPSAERISATLGGIFTSQSGNQTVYALLIDWQHNLLPIEGTPLNGLWTTTALFPQFTEAGTWRITYFAMKDTVTNTTIMDHTALADAGFPTELVVIKPSLSSDGQIGPSGGTVQDTVFGTRAQITLPPGAVDTSTEIAIDVFADPLQIPLSTGFAAAETKFVNIHLTPEPNYPLSPPGLTIVLPLVNHQIPGTSLFLYRVDPATGNLVSAIGVDGQPVSGTVDSPDGMSATFPGVASLSVVVGLVPDTIQVMIDIKPGGYPNAIKMKDKGMVPVAVLGSATFDVRTVNVTRLFWGAGLARPAHDLTKPSVYNDHLQDVNGDGQLDLVLHFPVAQAGINLSDLAACLRGETLSGSPIEGCDSIKVSQ